MITTDKLHIDSYGSEQFPNLVDQVSFYSFSSAETLSLFPEACFELIFQFGNFHQTLPDGKDWCQRPEAFVGGMHCQPFLVKSEDDTACLISVKLNPIATRYLFPKNLNNYRDRLVALKNIFSPEVLKTTGRLNEMERIEEKREWIDTFLHRIVVTRDKSPIEDAVHRVRETSGLIPLDKLTETSKLGVSQFRKRFAAEVGLSPKMFCRITRLNAIRDRLNEGLDMSLTELGYTFNYFDQAHFIRDFKMITGMTPKKYLLHLKL